MSERPSASSMTDKQRASGLVIGTLAAVALGALVRTDDELVALQLAAGGLLVAAGVLLWALRTGRAREAPDGADICGAASIVLLLLAPWSQSPPSDATTFSRASSPDDRNWLCHSSLLGAPYIVPRSRVLFAADPERASLLYACAQRRARAGVDVVRAHPRELGVPAARSRFGRARNWQLPARPRYDLVVVAVQPSAHVLPLGALPYASVPLETREGIRELLANLQPHGVLAATVVGEPLALRWLNTARSALATMGVTKPEHHVVVYGAAGAYTLLVSASPFDIDSVLAMHEAQRAEIPAPPSSLAPWPAWLRARPTLHATPGSAFDTRMADALNAEVAATLRDRYVFDIASVSDDRPLFFENTRRDRRDTWSSGTSYWVLGRALALATLFAAALTWLALRPFQRDAGATRMARTPRAALIGGYGALGIGHMLALSLVQQRYACWTSRPLWVPALCLFMWAAVSRAARRSRVPSAPARGPALALGLLAPAAFIALGQVGAPAPALTTKWGQGALYTLAFLALLALALTVAVNDAMLSRRTPQASVPIASIIYVAATALGALLAPTLVAFWGFGSCAQGAALALGVAAIAGASTSPHAEANGASHSSAAP